MNILAYVIVFGFIATDCVTGVIKAIKNKTFTSSLMREGLFHKLGNIIAVAFGVFIDYAQTVIDLNNTVPIAIPICVYISLMEIGSITENIGEINPNLMTDEFKQFFSKLKNKGGDK